MKKRILSIILAIAMLACMIPLGTLTAFATEHADKYWYVDENGNEVELTAADKNNMLDLNENSTTTYTSNRTWDKEFIFVSGNVELTLSKDRYIKISNNNGVKLILADGANLTISGNNTGNQGSIDCSSCNLTVYSQRKGTGEMTVSNSTSSGTSCTGIKGNKDYTFKVTGGNLNVYASTSTATSLYALSYAYPQVTGGKLTLKATGTSTTVTVTTVSKITVTGTGEAVLYGSSSKGVNIKKSNVTAGLIQTSTDGETWTDTDKENLPTTINVNWLRLTNPPAHTHVDENKDFVCDVCGYENRAGAEAAGFEYNDVDDNTILSYYSGSASEIVIPGWTTGTYGAFNANENITKVTIPASVEKIGGEAFWDCHSLVSVTFEEDSKLKTIGSAAFQYCRSLAEINLDVCKELETIGDSAFNTCESLTEINLDACQKLVTIDICAFYDTGLTSIHIPASVKEIGDEAFSTPEPLTDLYLNWTKAEDIVWFDFWGEDGTTVHIPAGTRSIYKNTSFSPYLPCVVTLVNATYDGQNTFTYFVGEGDAYRLEPADIAGKKFKEFVLDSDYEGVEITDCTLSIGDEVDADITVTAVYDTLSADYGALNAAISAADEITDSTLYTAGSWVKFRTAKDYAKSIGSDLDIRYQSKVDEAEAALTLATENLVKLSKSQYNMINEFCEYDGLMARQGKIVDGVVSDKVGRTIIPLTQDQLDSIDEYIWVVGFDGYKEFKVKIDCAYTWFYNGGDKIEAGVTPGLENYAAFIIIYNDGTDNDDNTITGFGYYRIYNGEIPDDGEGIMLDTLYLDPKFAVIPKELRNTAWTAQIDVEGGNSYDAILTIGIDSATLSFDGNDYTLPAVSYSGTELWFEDGTGSYLSIIDDGDAVGYIEGCVSDTIIVSVVESIEKA